MIAIVDDDPFIRDATADLLSSLGHPSIAFGSAEAFLDWNRGNDPLLCLILDQQLPGLSGLELQERLLLAGCPVSIIFITAYPDPTARERALNGGAVAYLSKPYNYDELVRALAKIFHS